MTKKIDIESLKNFNSAHYLSNTEDISEYIRIVEMEADINAFSEALNTIFLAMGANAVANALGMDVEKIWEVQEQPSDHLGNLQKIVDFLKEGLTTSSKPDNYF